MKTQFIDPFLTQSRRWSSPVIQFSITARCPREKIFNHMINIVLLLTMEISFIFFIISHPNPWTTVLVSTFETILSWRNRIFLCEKEIQMSVLHVRLVCSFICFDVVSPFTIVPPSLMQRITQERGGGELLCNARNRGVNLEYDFLRSSVGWE